MKIIFKDTNKTFTFNQKDATLEEVLFAVMNGLIAMGYNPDTANQFMKETFEESKDEM